MKPGAPETEGPKPAWRVLNPNTPATGQGPSMEAVVEPGNVKKALARVRRNKGAPGIDGMTVEELGAYLQSHWPGIKSRLLDGTCSTA